MALEIKWIGQGGYIFNLGDKILCVDPYLSNSMANNDEFGRLVPIPIQPEDLKADMIICTHDHIDHLDGATISNTNMDEILYGGPDSCIQHYKKIGIPDDNIVCINSGQTYELGEAKIHGVFAEHTEDSIGVVVEYDGVVIYLVGDSLYHERLLEVKKLDPNILISCINGRLGNMNYKEAANLAIELGVEVAIPSHYGMVAENTEDPNKFFECLKGSSISGIELEHDVPFIVPDVFPNS